MEKYAKTMDVPIRILTVMGHKRTDRVFNLEEYNTRCVVKNEVHELMIVDDIKTKQGAYYIGFIEMLSSGVIYKGMNIEVENKFIGKVLGFDYRHMPNHLNIVLENDIKNTGIDIGLEIFNEGIMKIKGEWLWEDF